MTQGLTETKQQDLFIVQGYRGKAHGMAKNPLCSSGSLLPNTHKL